MHPAARCSFPLLATFVEALIAAPGSCAHSYMLNELLGADPLAGPPPRSPIPLRCAAGYRANSVRAPPRYRLTPRCDAHRQVKLSRAQEQEEREVRAKLMSVPPAD